MMEQERAEDAASEHEASEGVYQGMDVWQLVQQLEAQRQQDPDATIALIQAYEQIVRQLQPNENPSLYASTQNNLGLAYSDLPIGDRASNLTQAIVCFQEALRFRTPETAPLEYAATQHNLGNAHYNLPIGDRGANLSQAITCYRQALRFRTPEIAPFDYASTQNNLGATYSDLPIGDRASNLTQAIICFQEALRFRTPETAPLEYAAIQNNLGNAYLELPTGDRGANVAQATACYQEALRFWTAETTPFDYAMAQNNLGLAYKKLPMGDRGINLSQAIACYQQALRFWTPETAPLEYAATQHNLGNAYLDLPIGDRGTNAAQAIACYQQALRFWTAETAPFDYASAQHNLGNAYLGLPTGDLAANIDQAIACYQQALHFWTAETAPFDYASAQHNLGAAYGQRLMGDREANLSQAIACYQQALRFWTAETAPFDYAMAQHSLGNAYQDLPTGDRAANLTRAIAYFQEALHFLTPETMPFEYARTQTSLGNAYSDLLTGDRGANLSQAIACYQQALRFWTAETAPFYYASTQINLGNAYSKRSTGGREANLSQAIVCYQQALRFWTVETAPFDYAMTQANLGLVYSQLPTGDYSATLALAIACFQEALRFSTLEIAPSECRRTNHYLADLHFAQGEWKAALDAYRAAMDAGERLYQADLSTESKATEVAENVALYCYAAFSAVRCGETTEALLILERGKTRLLAEALRLHVVRPVNVPDEVWSGFEHAGATVRATQARKTAMLGEERDPVQFHKTREQAARTANAALDEAIEHIRVYASEFLQPIDLPTIQTLLPDERTALVAFCITDQGSMGFVVDHHHDQSVQVVEVPTFTQAELSRLFIEVDADGRVIGGWLGDYDRSLMEPTPAALATWRETITKTLATLGQRLLAPVLFTLSPDVERIIFLPSAELFLLPLHAAPLSNNDPERLCDRYQVSYAPSIEVLADIQAKAIRRVSPDVYAVINPQGDPDLVFTSIEGAAVAGLFTQHSVDEGRDGTKQRVVAGAQGRSYVHFSCHGSYDWDDPMASGLDLADGRLTLAELQQGVVDLSSARLVTLSACETGITDVVQGSPEEYVGVPAGFLLAGVPCVVSSLWEVPDLSTALLIERFYRNHLKSGMDFAAALREAQIWVRELRVGDVAAYAEQCYRQSQQKEQPEIFRLMRYYRHQVKQNPALRPFAHPYYWAAFTVNGM